LETVEDRIEEADLRIGEKQDRLDQLADERETALQYQQFRDELEEYRGFLKASELEEKRETLAGVEEDTSTTTRPNSRNSAPSLTPGRANSHGWRRT